MESIIQFWNRAFPNLHWSRKIEVLPTRAGALPLSRPTLVFDSGLGRASDWLPQSIRIPMVRVSDKRVPGAAFAFFHSRKDEFLPERNRSGLHGKVDRRPAIVPRGDTTFFAFDPEAIVGDMLREWGCGASRPIASFCPFHYHAVPGWLRRVIGRLTTMLQSTAEDDLVPVWPGMNAVDVLRYCVLLCGVENPPAMSEARFWPEGKTWAVSLSHDADTKHGMANVPQFFELEQQHGITSTWFFPARHYVLDRDLLRQLLDAGHEIACHGYNHDCVLPYLKPKWIGDRLRKSAERLSDVGARGFRSPALGRTPQLFDELPAHFDYDSSVPDVDGKSGCRTLFPFFLGNLLEIPITVPMDATLMLHGDAPETIARTWRRKLDFIRERGGLATLVTHPEPHFSGRPEMVRIYAELLEYLADQSDCWLAPMAHIADWWRKGGKAVRGGSGIRRESTAP